jgi:hypothetical protein
MRISECGIGNPPDRTANNTVRGLLGIPHSEIRIPHSEVIMSSATDSTSDPRHPFGLPLGSVRALMALAIGVFFWVVLLFPGEPAAVRPPLGHFFLLALVTLAFSPHTGAAGEDGSAAFPWLIRLVFLGGTVATVAFVGTQFPDRLAERLTPDPLEVKRCWLPLLASTFGGFAVGVLIRVLLGRASPFFRTLRSWFSVVGLVMLALEIGFVLVGATSQAPTDFLQYWDAVELAVVAAYFGTRA